MPKTTQEIIELYYKYKNEPTLWFSQSEVNELIYVACNKTLEKAKEHERKIIDQLRKELKESVYNLYRKIGKGVVFSVSNDVVCDMCEDFVNQRIDEIINKYSAHKGLVEVKAKKDDTTLSIQSSGDTKRSGIGIQHERSSPIIVDNQHPSKPNIINGKGD